MEPLLLHSCCLAPHRLTQPPSLESAAGLTPDPGVATPGALLPFAKLLQFSHPQPKARYLRASPFPALATASHSCTPPHTSPQEPKVPPPTPGAPTTMLLLQSAAQAPRPLTLATTPDPSQQPEARSSHRRVVPATLLLLAAHRRSPLSPLQTPDVAVKRLWVEHRMDRQLHLCARLCASKLTSRRKTKPAPRPLPKRRLRLPWPPAPHDLARVQCRALTSPCSAGGMPL